MTAQTVAQSLTRRLRVDRGGIVVPWIVVFVFLPISSAAMALPIWGGEYCDHPISSLFRADAYEQCVTNSILIWSIAGAIAFVAVIIVALAIAVALVRMAARRREKLLRDAHEPMLRQMEDWFVHGRIERAQLDAQRAQLDALAQGAPGRVAHVAGRFTRMLGILLAIAVLLWGSAVITGAELSDVGWSCDEPGGHVDACTWADVAGGAFLIAGLATATAAVGLIVASAPLLRQGRRALDEASREQRQAWEAMLEAGHARRKAA